jgi:hypothetical protein
MQALWRNRRLARADPVLFRDPPDKTGILPPTGPKKTEMRTLLSLWASSDKLCSGRNASRVRGRGAVRQMHQRQVGQGVDFLSEGECLRIVA